jgi:tetratricopeptide (TPR) repeat protein
MIAAGCASRSAIHVDANAAEKARPVTAESLSSYIAKARELSTKATARPPLFLGMTAETYDAQLAVALGAASASPSPETYRRVAAEYARVGIFDKAHEYLTNALRFDDRDSATYEARARLWRDGHLPQAALGDAHRAVYFAPDWAVAHNTLGTVLQALGRRMEARREYEQALRLDPKAAYALNHICYGWILDGRIAQARDACTRALAIDPDLHAARNNLGLAQAIGGDPKGARQSFEAAADPAGALYNVGIVELAQRQYRSAVESFQAAQELRPSFPLAVARERQARDQMNGGTR